MASKKKTNAINVSICAAANVGGETALQTLDFEHRRGKKTRFAGGTKMADKLSSPSSSSSHSGQTIRSRSTNGDEPHLVIRQNPPTHVYSDEPFDVAVSLEIPTTSSPVARTEEGAIHLEATLLNAKSGRRVLSTEATLVLNPPSISIRCHDNVKEKLAKFQCAVRIEAIRRDQHTSFAIRIAQRNDVEQGIRDIPPVVTRPLFLVKYKTKITTNEDWENVWYKDEGGRDKCMEVSASLYDRHNQLITGLQVPTKVTLFYETDNGPTKVADQGILRMLGTLKPQVEKDTGKARIRFRVEDVSKNHQKKNFMVQIGPDPKSKGHKDIAYGFAPAVAVRSKRNNKKRQAGSSHSRGSAAVRGSPTQRQRTTANIMYEEPKPASREVFSESTDITRLRDAMKDVLNWTDEVVNGLFPLQWQIIGYHQNPDGTPNYNRPYHNMPDPNPCINRVITSYSDSVRESLRVLLHAVEQANPGRQEAGYANIPPSVPGNPDDPFGIMMQAQGAQPGSAASNMGLPMHGREMAHHATLPSEPYRSKPPPDNLHYQHPSPAVARRPQLGQVVFPEPMHMRPSSNQIIAAPAARSPRLDEKPAALARPMQSFLDEQDDSREGEVEYVLAKVYKAARTGERLGYPAYSANKQILGFYQDPHTRADEGPFTPSFTPISRLHHHFGPMEIMQANQIVEVAMTEKSPTLLALESFGSIQSLIDHALVLDWTKDMGNDPAQSTGS